MTSTDKYKNYETEWPKFCVDPDQIVTFNGVDMKIKDVPDREARADWGMGHYGVHMRGRKIHPEITPGGWKYDPESCLLAGESRGISIGDGEICCPGCGLDGT